MNIDIKLAKIAKIDKINNNTNVILYIDDKLYKVKYMNYQVDSIFNNINYNNIFVILLDNKIIGYSNIDKSKALLTIDEHYLSKYNISYYDFCRLVGDKIKYRGLYIEKFKFNNLIYNKDYIDLNIKDNDRSINTHISIYDRDYHYVYLLRNLQENDDINIIMDDEEPVVIIFNDVDFLIINKDNNMKRISDKYGISEDNLEVLLYKLIYDQNTYFHIDNRHV